jgi:hypothetical protein
LVQAASCKTVDQSKLLRVFPSGIRQDNPQVKDQVVAKDFKLPLTMVSQLRKVARAPIPPIKLLQITVCHSNS